MISPAIRTTPGAPANPCFTPAFHKRQPGGERWLGPAPALPSAHSPPRGRVLYSCAHSADCELRLVGHDVRGLQVSVIHRIFKRCSDVGVFMACVAIEWDFWSSPAGCQRENPVSSWLLLLNCPDKRSAGRRTLLLKTADTWGSGRRDLQKNLPVGLWHRQLPGLCCSPPRAPSRAASLHGASQRSDVSTTMHPSEVTNL